MLQRGKGFYFKHCEVGKFMSTVKRRKMLILQVERCSNNYCPKKNGTVKV
jgi:hypothetical protein